MLRERKIFHSQLLTELIQPGMLTASQNETEVYSLLTELRNVVTRRYWCQGCPGHTDGKPGVLIKFSCPDNWCNSLV